MNIVRPDAATQSILYASSINGEAECSTKKKTENVWENTKEEFAPSLTCHQDNSLLERRLRELEEGHKEVEVRVDALEKHYDQIRESRGWLGAAFSIVSGDWDFDKLRQIGGGAHRAIRNALSRSVHSGRSVDSRFPQPPAIQRIDIAEEDGNVSESESSDDERIVPDNRTFKPLPSFAEKKERT